MRKLKEKIFKIIHPTKAAKNAERAAEEQRQRVLAAAAHSLEMARIQEEQQLAHIAAVMLAAKAEIEAWYESALADSQEQYAQSHNDYVKSLNDVQQSQDNYAQELTKEHKAQIAALIQSQQADEEYLEQCYTLLSEMLNELQEYAKAEPAQVQLNTVDITECSELIAELNQLLQEHDIDCLDTPQANITVAEAIEVITAIQGSLAIAQQELHEKYELAILELNAEFAQKLLDSKDMHEQMLAQVEAQWLEYQSNHNAYVTSLAEHRGAQLNDINNQELQEIANVHAAYQAHVAAINAEMQLRLKEIDDNLLAQAEHLKRSAQSFMIAAVTMVAAGVVAYFSAGLLAGFSAHIINFVRTTLAVTSLRAAERLANGQGGVSVDVSANLAPQPKPYTPPPVVQPKLNTKVAIEDSEQKVPATNTFSDRMQSVQNSTVERHKLLQEVHGQGYIPESSLATIGVVAVASATTQLVKDVAHTAGAIIDMCADGHASIFSASDTHRVEALQRNIERADNIKQAISNVVKNPSVIADYYKDRMQHAANSFETAFERGDLVGAGKAMGQNLYDASTVLSIASGATAFTAKVATGAAKTANSFVAANKFVAPVTFQYKGATLYSGIPFDVVKVRNPVVPKAPAANMPKPPTNVDKLTKSQLVDYLQNVDKLPMTQLVNDLEQIGFRLLEHRPDKKIYKFSHVKNELRELDKVKANIGSSKIMIEIHFDAKSGPHMHITDTYGNVYDKHLNNLTAKFRKENPNLSEKVIEKKVARMPEAHIEIKEFVQLAMRPVND